MHSRHSRLSTISPATVSSAERGTRVRTLHFTNSFHATSGGIRTFYRALIEAAATLGRRVALVVPDVEDSIVDIHPWARIYSLAAPRSPIIDTRYRLVLPQKFLLTRQNKVRAILASERPDLVEINDKFSLCYLAGVLRKRWWPEVARPTLVGSTSERLDDGIAAQIANGTAARRLSDWYMRRIYAPMFDYHIANSPYTADEIRAALPAWRNEHVTWLPMGVDIARLAPVRRDEVRRRELLGDMNRDQETVLLIYAGRMSKEKEVMVLLSMLRILDDRSRVTCRLVIAGDGPLRRSFEDEARRMVPGRVRVLGHISNSHDLASSIASSDLFVHPNPREPFGIGPLEAMAIGTPVVAPASGGLLAYANSRNAWLTEPSAKGLAAAVEEAWRNVGERQRRAARARETASAYAWPEVAARWFRCFDELHVRGRYEWGAARHEGVAASR